MDAQFGLEVKTGSFEDNRLETTNLSGEELFNMSLLELLPWHSDLLL